MADGTSKLVIAIRDAHGVVSNPNPIQIEWLKNERFHRYCMFGGGYGSSKTTAVCRGIGEEISRSLRGELPPLKIALCHETYESAYDVLVKRLFGEHTSIIPRYIGTGRGKIDLQQGLNKSDHKLLIGFPGKDPILIYWTGLDDSKGLPQKFRNSGLEFDIIGISQADRLEETALIAARDRLGRREIKGFTPRILIDTNICAGWPKQIFVLGDHYKGDNADWYYFLNSKTSDNLALGKDYIQSGLASPNAKQTFYGEWDDAQTLVYNQFKRAMSLVLESDIPFKETWRVDAALDYGRWQHPFAVLFSAIDHDGNLWFLDEAELYHFTARQAADSIKGKHFALLTNIAERLGKNEALPIAWGGYYGGQDFNQRDDNGHSIAAQMMRNMIDEKSSWEGISVQTVGITANVENRERAFVNSLHELMIPVDGHKHPVTGVSPAPRVYFSSKCERLIAQITAAEYDPDRIDRVKKTVVRNKFEADQSRVHHWDLHDCALIAAQRAIYAKEPKEKEQYKEGYAYMNKRKQKAIHYA
jgi:hypothetical protein